MPTPLAHGPSSRTPLLAVLPPLLGAILILRSLAAPSPEVYRPPAFTQTNRVALVRAQAAEIEKIYRDYAASEHIPGLAYGIVVDDTLVLSGAFGFTELARRTPATPKSVFRIASMTKSFTALAVLRLRDAGKLDLDRPVSRHLPELRRLPLLTRDAPPITPRHLLTHGAGFPEDNPWGDRQLADSDADLVDLMRSPVQFSTATGTEFEYSNLGFALLGRLVRRASGQSCQAYLDAHVLRPLGMHSTYWEPARVPPELLAHGYRWHDSDWQEEPLLADGSFAPMGGLLTSVEDFSRYMALHLSAWPPRDDADPGPLRRSSLREMHQPARLSGLASRPRPADGSPCPEANAYAYGLASKVDCLDRVRVGHSGGLPGFGSDWRMLPQHGIGVVALGNRTYSGLGRPTAKVVDLLLDQARLLPRQLPVSDILRRRAEQLVALLPDWGGAEASGIFAENFFPDHPVAERREETRDLFRQAGDILSVDPVQPRNQLRGTVKVHGRHATLEIFLTLTPENPPLIQEFEIVRAP